MSQNAVVYRRVLSGSGSTRLPPRHAGETATVVDVAHGEEYDDATVTESGRVVVPGLPNARVDVIVEA